MNFFERIRKLFSRDGNVITEKYKSCPNCHGDNGTCFMFRHDIVGDEVAHLKIERIKDCPKACDAIDRMMKTSEDDDE